MINQRFLWIIKAISTPKEHDSSFLNIDPTSHESLQLKQLSHKAVWRLMQYLIFSILFSNFRRH